MMLKTELKEFQNETIQWMIEHENKYDGGMLLSSAGSGKSICAIGTIINNPLKTLIVCPAGLVDNWINEFLKHTNISRLKIVKYYGGKRCDIILNEKQIVYITSYSIISREFKGSCFEKTSIFNKVNFQRIILDEAHYIRNATSIIHKSILFLGDSYKLDIKKWIITATPIFNNTNDSYGYFKFLNLEGIDSKADWSKKIPKNVEGLHVLNKLFETYALCIKKEDVLLDLKKKNEQLLQLDFNNIEQEFYNALKQYSFTRMKSLITRIKKLDKQVCDITDMKKILHTNVMVYILRLKQACNSPWLIINSMNRLKGTINLENAIKKLDFYNNSKNIEDECPICYDMSADYIANPCGHKCCEKCWNKMFNIGISICPICRTYVDNIECVNEKNEEEIEEFEEIEEIGIDLKDSVKIRQTIELTKKVIKNNEKIIIVSQWVSMLNLMREFFDNDTELSNVKYIYLQGSVQLKDRTEAIHNFQTNNDIKICFISLMSSAEGINLVASNHLVLMDSWWNNAKMLQVSDRCHRIGQIKDVNIYTLQIKNSIEEQIERLVTKKDKISKLILTKWNIQDKKQYDDSWMKNIIKLLETP